MKTIRRSRRAAFTLLEIMLVVAIIALLLGTGFAFLGPQFAVGQDAKLHADFQAIGQSLQAYENLNGFLPTNEQGLQALVSPPQSEPKPSHWNKMMDKIPQDPWKNDYIYVYPGKHNPDGFDIISKGKDRIADTADDRGNWEFK